MAIEIYVEPRKVYSWDDFKKSKTPYSIGLDGFIDAPTQRDPKGPYANYDHHTKTDRLATRSTTDQVHLEINMGLFDTFNKDGIPTANIYINDPDEDTCLASWLLKNHDIVINHAQPRINRLVYCEDRLDSTAGGYPLGKGAFRRQMAWIFEPYNNVRFTGKLYTMDASEIKNVIESVHARISEHIFNNGGEIALKGNYEKIGGGEGWTFAKETGPASRISMYNDGICAFVSLITKKDDGSYVYTLGRASVWNKFDLPRFYKLLNECEKDIVTDSNFWGGSDTIGGSPRLTGSNIPPEKLQELIGQYLQKK